MDRLIFEPIQRPSGMTPRIPDLSKGEYQYIMLEIAAGRTDRAQMQRYACENHPAGPYASMFLQDLFASESAPIAHKEPEIRALI